MWSEKIIAFNKDGIKHQLFSITEQEVTPEYVDGLRKQNHYIENTNPEITIEEQKEYIRKIHRSKGNAIFGLYNKKYLIGTAGVQRINKPGQTTLGVFVIEKKNRGKGYGTTLIWASSWLLISVLKINTLLAGVNKNNLPSIYAFKKCGYSIDRESKDAYILKLDEEDLIMPKGISCEDIIGNGQG